MAMFFLVSAPLRFSRSRFSAKAQRHRDAKGGVKLWLHIQLTLMQKKLNCGGAKYNGKEKPYIVVTMYYDGRLGK